MVFIRRVRTASGATAVQIAEYVGGGQRIVKHVGSAHNEVELGVLMARARALLKPWGQDEFDLGIEATPLVAPLLVGAAAQPELFAATDAARGVVPVRAGAARVVTTDARVVFEALTSVYCALGFDATQTAYTGCIVSDADAIVKRQGFSTRLPQFRVTVNSRCGRACFLGRPSSEAVSIVANTELDVDHLELDVAVTAEGQTFGSSYVSSG